MSSRLEEIGTEPRTVDEARSAVERSRERISNTLDALEDRIVEKKHEIQDRVDVLKPVRQQVENRPFTAVAVAVGVGALLGSLGGRGRDEDRGSRRGSSMKEEDRAELREWRRMRRERLEARTSRSDAAEDAGPGRLDALKHQLAGAVTSAIGAVVTAKVREFTGTGSTAQRSDRDRSAR
jgi:ElaB/YqjD/DUF883 family membrane-anchored ribosome-binding protein